MKKSLIAAAALAAMMFGGATLASAGVAGSSLAGISTHNNTQITDQVGWRKNVRHRRNWRHRHHSKRWVCKWRHGHKHCWWRR